MFFTCIYSSKLAFACPTFVLQSRVVWVLSNQLSNAGAETWWSLHYDASKVLQPNLCIIKQSGLSAERPTEWHRCWDASKILQIGIAFNVMFFELAQHLSYLSTVKDCGIFHLIVHLSVMTQWQWSWQIDGHPPSSSRLWLGLQKHRRQLRIPRLIGVLSLSAGSFWVHYRREMLLQGSCAQVHPDLLFVLYISCLL